MPSSPLSDDVRFRRALQDLDNQLPPAWWEEELPEDDDIPKAWWEEELPEK